MPLWTNYHYNEEDYKLLIASLRNPNKYRYGLLLKEEPKIKGGKNGTKVFKLPEGYLILSHKPKGRYYEYQDLEKKPIKLIPFIIWWNPKIQRIQLQINRDYVRLQIKRIKALSSSAFWIPPKRKGQRDYIKAVNNLTRELWEVSRYAFVFPDTRRAYNNKVKKIVYKYLTSVIGLSRNQALQTINKYLTRF